MQQSPRSFSWKDLGRGEKGSEVSHRLFVRAIIEVQAETRWGDTVVMCGSTPQLGSWQPHRALRMVTDETAYPVWRCEPLLLCTDRSPL